MSDQQGCEYVEGLGWSDLDAAVRSIGELREDVKRLTIERDFAVSFAASFIAAMVFKEADGE